MSLKKSTTTLGGMKGRRRRRAAERKQGENGADVTLRPAEVELMRDLWETGLWSLETLAEKFDVPAAIVKGLVHFKLHR